jgi:RNA polymerase sigma-70 factor (ECF subfamily)
VTQEKEIARERTFHALRQAISSQLTERQRLALTAELNEMPQSEIARQLGTTRNTVYKLTHDARKTLKRVLNEAGVTAEMIGWAFASDQRSFR